MYTLIMLGEIIEYSLAPCRTGAQTGKNMELAIKVNRLDCGSYLAEVDWSKGDAGKVGTPGASKYGDSEAVAYESLKICLEEKGHTLIE